MLEVLAEYESALDGERIDGQRLNRRAALPLALHGAVEAARYGFLAAAAGKGAAV